jgi:hypothetical protein
MPITPTPKIWMNGKLVDCPMGVALIDEYHRVVEGKAPVHKDWLEYV